MKITNILEVDLSSKQDVLAGFEFLIPLVQKYYPIRIHDLAPLSATHLPTKVTNYLFNSGFSSIRSVRVAKDKDILRINGVGEAQLKLIRGVMPKYTT
ncbi:MAG: hypothetical protein KCHDKBKB_00659 [Elusimicrobia bacterium]|nr:hypothetical protein [Elusimicrobiota bacterium]